MELVGGKNTESPPGTGPKAIDPTELFRPRTLEDWILRFGQCGNILLERARWQILRSPSSPMHSDDAVAGMESGVTAIDAFPLCGVEAKSVPLGHSPSKPHQFVYLGDWERLWSFLVADTVDEIAIEIPFLKLCVDIIFHHRTVQLMYLLYFWNIMIYAILDAALPGNIAGAYFGSTYVTVSFELGVYLCACWVNRGLSHCVPFHSPSNAATARRPPADHPSLTPPAQAAVNAQIINVDDRELHAEKVTESAPYFVAIKRMLRQARQEFSAIRHGQHGSNKNVQRKQDARTEQVSYYDWLNIAMKLLTQSYQVDLQKLNFNRTSYRLVLLFTMFLYPIYIIGDFVGNYMEVTGVFCGDSDSAPNCVYVKYLIIGTAGSLTLLTSQFLFGASVLVSLAGLAYSGEVAFRLAECWMHRFGCLRRLTVHGLVTEQSPNNNNQSGLVHEQPNQHADSVALMLKRDATEHYLLICELMRQAGRIWSPVITGLLFLTVYICLVNIIFLCTNLASHVVPLFVVRNIIYIIIRMFMMVVYPLLSVAYANSYLLKLSDVFRIAGDDDFVLVGGRDYWLQFLSNFPPVWTYYGVYVTPDRLLAVCWTGILTAAGIVFSAFLSSS